MKKIISKRMLYAVCNGERNLATKKAILVGKYTKTDPMVWMDPAHKEKRKEFKKALELSGLVEEK